VTALPGPAASVRAVAGAGQRAAVGTTLPKAIVLRVADAAGNAVPGARVTLAPAAGAVPDSAPVTDTAGVVRTRWTLPIAARPAVYHLTARVEGVVQPVDVTAAGIPPAARAPSRSRRRHV
jgi:hypothetical protein